MAILSLFKTKKKKSRRAYLIAQIDAIVSIQVRERDGNRCRKCGRQPCYHHHIFTKTRLATRWTLKNGVTLCFHCHRWAHAAGEEFRQWVLSWMDQGEYDQLYLWSQTRAGYRVCDLELLLWGTRKE
jgi:5-methylcytosine-specific restriction endonuclease McrA